MGTRATMSCVLLGLALLSACGGEVGFDLPPVDAAVDAPPPPPVVPVVRIESWPGMGMQLAVEVPDRVAAENPGGVPTAWLETAAGQRIDAVVAPAQVGPGLTAVVILPSADPIVHAQRQAAADALLRALPADERVALFVARDHAELLADLAVPRGHARARLAALAPEASLNALFAMREARELLADAQSDHGALGRTAIVVGDSVGDDPPEVRRVVQVLTMPVGGDPAAVAAAVVAQQAARRASLVRIGACPAFAADTPFTLHLGDGYARDLYAPMVMDHVVGLPCDAADAAADRYPYPSEIDFTFTPEQRTVFDQVYASANELLPFTLSVNLGGSDAITATAHLRGQGTLACPRKSFTVELDSPRQRLMPGVAASRFFLISMCQDEYYFGQAFADRILGKLDLFAPHLRYVKLVVGGQNRGLYLLMDQPDNALRDNGVAIQSVIRRRYDIDMQPAEVKFPDDMVLAAEEAARFEAIGELARNGPIANLDAELHARIDLDAYTKLLAAYSLLQNGDFIDEFFFYGSTELGGEYFRTMGWDTDDTFSLCHGGGGRGIVDRCRLAYCAEAKLDYALVRSEDTYRRFLASIDLVLAQVTPDLMATTMAELKQEMWAVLDDDATALGLSEIGSPTTKDAARTAIEGRMNVMLGAATASHASLMSRRAMCPVVP